ncbi:hypothetical protein CSB07_00050 [Candidatus Gracilibacteria bacterium]|nr:MAG: hypothetical protein CSB07_00050 [Candidatus Gracilibacteria bacterium]PIE85668.1 MAG: hypothetical protein CSA08_00795 [Candidatus Gracilibacteria bacterium]
MKKLINKSIYIILSILLFCIPIINSHLLDFFGIKLGIYVNGNYEFTKVMFFNIISGIILILFGIKTFFNKKKVIIPKYTLFFIIMILFSTIFSLSLYTSLFGNSEKGHSLIMFTNLLGVFIILLNTQKKILNNLLKILIISALITCIIGIWQLYFPSFDYKELSDRLIGTFGHPNYISLFFLLIIPLLYPINERYNIKKYIKIVFLFILLIGLILTKSFIAIFLTFSYLFFVLFKNKKYKLYIFTIFIFLGIILIIKIFPEKLSSLISRFFIWETTLKIIFSNIKIFFIGGGTETLSYLFDNYKSEYLYIFEQIGFTADRPHNIILNFFYHFGILGLIFILTIYITITKKFINKKTPINISLFLGSIFLLLNFASIASYLLIILLFSLSNSKVIKVKANYLGLIFIIIPILGIYYSYKFYISEIYAYKNNYETAIKYFPYNPYNYYKIGDYKSGLEKEKLKSEKYYLTKIYSLKNPEKDCKKLIKNYYSVENYLFCGNFLWEIGKYKDAKSYYKNGTKKLPDLWNDNSKYYNNIIIKKFISGNRFFSEKYSNIKQILKRIN